MNSLINDRTTEYARAVLTGAIVAGPHVRNACRRHLEDLQREDIRFDLGLASRAFRFFEQKLRLSEGQFEGRPFRLTPAQSFIVGSIFGWVRPTGFRRFRRAYIEQGKGNGKSPLAGGIGLYGMLVDGEAGAEIYSAGATKEQAAILFRDAVKMVGQSPALDERVRRSGGPGREYELAYLKNGSFFRPVSRETRKTGSGPRPHFALVDELHEHPDGGVVEMLERGFKFRRQPLLLMITNSGSDRNSVCYAEHEWACKVASGNRDAPLDSSYVGEVLDDTVFSYVCALDPGDNPLSDPSCWIKANPLLNVTITDEYLQQVVSQARNIPSKQNGILRLHFCSWTDASSAWLNREAVEPVLSDFDPAEHIGNEVYMGLDLSQCRDITALAVVTPTGFVESQGKDAQGRPVTLSKPTFDAWVECWTPGDTIQARSERDKLPYPIWAEAGHIHAPPGEIISFQDVAQTLALYNQDYSVKLVAYDRYAFRRFESNCTDIGLSLPFVEHPQGGVRKGPPSEAIKKEAERRGKKAEGLWFPSSLRLLEDAILEKRVRLRRNPVLISAIMSSVVEQDRWDNRWLAKQKSVNKIDAAVALVLAFGAANSLHSAYDSSKLQMFFI